MTQDSINVEKVVCALLVAATRVGVASMVIDCVVNYVMPLLWEIHKAMKSHAY